MIKPQTLKGFRDFLPSEARKRQFVINTLKSVFESYGFEPLETPALEYEEILLGKYGDEGDKLMYRFTDRGGRKVALRYDQTVPLARVVAQYQNQLSMPFKRYQIQNVWRAENTQKGRFREFLQCDIDTIGLSSAYVDAEIIVTVEKALKSLGFNKFKILLSSRNLLFDKIKAAGIKDEIAVPVIRVIDKINKIGWAEFGKELLKLGLSKEQTSGLNSSLSTIQPIEDPYLNRVWAASSELGATSVKWYPYLARGLDYYTGLIFEVEVEGYKGGSVGGGGRYDNLIGLFSGKQIPAVGFAFGFDRLIEAMDSLNLFPQGLTTTKVLVAVFSPEFQQKSLDCSLLLRSSGVPTELYLDENAKLDKQLKYADQKGISYAIIIGPDEASNNLVTLRNMKTREQKIVSLGEALSII